MCGVPVSTKRLGRHIGKDLAEARHFYCVVARVAARVAARLAARPGGGLPHAAHGQLHLRLGQPQVAQPPGVPQVDGHLGPTLEAHVEGTFVGQPWLELGLPRPEAGERAA